MMSSNDDLSFDRNIFFQVHNNFNTVLRTNLLTNPLCCEVQIHFIWYLHKYRWQILIQIRLSDHHYFQCAQDIVDKMKMNSIK